MNSLQGILTSPAAQILGWALLHFLWQGLLIAVLLKMILKGIPVHLAGLRYWIAAAAMMSLLCMPVISICKAIPPRTATAAADVRVVSWSIPTGASAQDAVDSAVRVPVDPGIDWPRLARERLGPLGPWLAMVWFGGTVLIAAIMLGGLLSAQFLKRSATSLSGDQWMHRMASLTTDSRARKPIQLLESDRVSVPTVIGWFRPAILLPAGAAGELAAEHLDALLAHELAHIRRRDYLVNLLQTSIEVLLWYHPATWWVASQVRTERECCCDDEAVAACGNPLTYARALSRAERLRSASNWAIALSGASLLNRIRRLTEMKTPNLSRFAVCLIGLIAIGLILAAGAGSSLLAYVPALAIPQVSAAPIQLELPARAKTEQNVPAQERFVRPTENLMRKQTLLLARLGPKISGHVYDPTGAVVPGVAISLVASSDKQLLVSTLSDAQGYFEIDTFTNLDFELRFALAGFALQVLTNRNLTNGPLEVTLELGQIREMVTVTAGALSGSPAAAPNSPIRVGGNIVAPKVIRRVDPAYPPQAKVENVEGSVVVSALIDEEGQVRDAVIISGHSMLREAALATVQQWRYTPAMINGQPWPLRLSITLVFKLIR